jgi:hypothetical protein
MKFSGSCILLGVFLCVTVTLAGCNRKSKLQQMVTTPMVPVEGKVTLGGKPLGGGILYFYAPEGEGKAYTPLGFIDSQGNYSVNTSGEKGAPAGKYRVTVEPGSGDKSIDLAVDPMYQSSKRTPFVIEVRENAPPGAYDLKMEFKKKH